MTHRTTTVGGVRIPTATTTRAATCPSGHVHLIGQDDQGSPICEIVVGVNVLKMILDAAEDSGLLHELGQTPCPPTN